MVKGAVVIEGHVQGLANTRSLGREGIPVYVVSRHSCLAGYSKYCKKFFKCPDYLSYEFTQFLVELCRKENLNGWMLLPSNDHAVYNISINKAILEKYYKIISPDKDIFENIYNKENLINICKSIDIPVPTTWFPSVNSDIDYSVLVFPVLVKGKKGLSFYKKQGKKAFLAQDEQELKYIIDRIISDSTIEDIFIQNVLPFERQKPVSFTAFCIEGEIKTTWSGSKVREHPFHFGTATFSSSCDIPALKPYAESIIRHLRFTGVCEIEFMLDERDLSYKLIEINARTWLWVEMAIRSGINYPLFVYNYLNDIPVFYPLRPEKDVEWIHYLTDLPYSISGIIKGEYSLSEILETYKHEHIDAVYSRDDKLPSFAEFFLLPFLIFRR